MKIPAVPPWTLASERWETAKGMALEGRSEFLFAILSADETRSGYGSTLRPSRMTTGRPWSVAVRRAGA